MIRLLFAVLTVLVTMPAQAARQQQGLCSEVSVNIQQELALERVGFLATLEVTNNEGDASLTNFSAALTFGTRAYSEDGTLEEASDYFFVQPPTMTGIDAVDGTGIIPPGQTAVVQWFIIPTVLAGGTTPVGIDYEIGAQLGGALYGTALDAETLLVNSDVITVKPDPQLDITYFQPRDVEGDNPFTPDIVEPPVPFTLGVLVNNVGYGPAINVRIASEQPEIVANEQDLLVVPQLLGSRVDDAPTDYASLTVELGNILPNHCRKAAWDMITTLEGEFTEFSASYTHAPELGGRDTSVIVGLNAYFLSHEVRNDQPGRDDLRDFLAQVFPPNPIPGLPNVPGEIIPDTLFETDCNQLPVNVLTNVTPGPLEGSSATVSAVADYENWVVMIVDDPAQAQLPISRVVRSDGKVLDPNNHWTQVRFREGDNARLPFLFLFDFVQLGVQYDYTVEYEPIGDDVTAPVTTLIFSGPHERQGDTVYVLPETRMLFLVDDVSPSGTWVRVDTDGDFVPAYPFTIEEPGIHSVEYYSVDVQDNQENTRAVTVVVAPDMPTLEGLSLDNTEVHLTGAAVSVRPDDAAITFDADAGGLSMVGEVAVYRGAFAAPQLLGVPSSPTAADTADITVVGDRVDLYRYRVGSGAWSQVQSVSTPLSLTGLSGVVDLEVKGWSQYGEEPSDEDALAATWVVDPSAFGTVVTPGQPYPTLSDVSSFSVSGVDQYRWTYPGSYLRAQTPVSETFSLPRLPPGDYSVDVIGELGGVWQSEGAPTSVPWRYEPTWGHVFPDAAKVRTVALGGVVGGSSWVWDGRDDAGNPAPPGWYTVSVTVVDGLGRETTRAVLVRVGDLLADADDFDAPVADQDFLDAEAGWVVWRDQRSGAWDIYVAPVDGSTPPQALTGDGRNHERPRTDGYLVVWQDRRADGSWDVWAKTLGTAEPAFAVAPSAAFDQTRPTVFWPWVVWQEMPVADPTAPEQLVAYNLLDDTTRLVDGTTQDQLDPFVHGDLVVWQDFRDVGFGEIYLQDLSTGVTERITFNAGGQYHPVVQFPWVVWADNRDGDFDLYAKNLLAPVERALTDTPENETRPSIEGEWIVYTDDAWGGVLDRNVRAMHLPTGGAVQLTNAPSTKERAQLTQGHLLWVERPPDGPSAVRVGTMPDLQPVAANTNLVAITPGLTARVPDVHTLLSQWHEAAGVTRISRYTSLLPTPVEEAAVWSGGPSGPNFALEAGSFLWVAFDAPAVLDFDASTCSPKDLAAGTNVFGYACFPDDYTAFALLRDLGPANVSAIRALDRRTGAWAIATVQDGVVVGEDFPIDTVSVVMLDMVSEVNGWTP
jgi:hypothetical protein